MTTVLICFNVFCNINRFEIMWSGICGINMVPKPLWEWLNPLLELVESVSSHFGSLYFTLKWHLCAENLPANGAEQLALQSNLVVSIMLKITCLKLTLTNEQVAFIKFKQAIYKSVQVRGFAESDLRTLIWTSLTETSESGLGENDKDVCNLHFTKTVFLSKDFDSC